MDEILLHFKSQEFKEVWEAWFVTRKELKYSCTERVRRKWGRWLINEKFTEEDAIKCIRYCDTRDWEGLYDNRKKYNNGGQQTGKTGTSVNRVEAIKQRRLGGL